MAMDAFDLAERFQTLVFVMSDLDLGMNTWMSDPFPYPDKPLDRGKLLDEETLQRARRAVGALQGRGRRRHPVPDDPGRRHAGVFHARLRSQRARAVQRAPDDYSHNMDRLARKFETAEALRAAGNRGASRRRDRRSSATARATGRSTRAAISCSSESGIRTAYLRLRAYPFTSSCSRVHRRDYKRVYVVEQNRDAQMLHAAAHGSAARARSPSCGACCTTTGCRSTRARSPTRFSCRKAQEGTVAEVGRPLLAGGDRPAGQWTGNRRTKPRMDTGKKKPTASASRCTPYRGGKTTLCAGCGHNAISERIIDAFFEMGIDPRDVIKLSGIGCSSKSPAYFLGGSHGFNSVHGRMPSVGTGALLANQQADRHRRQRRRRHRRDRHRPVRAPDAPQRADDLHHRGQRLLRPDEGAVLADGRPRLDAEDRRRQRPAADRHLRARHRARRVVRGALVLRRQEAAAVDPQGVAQPSRHRA